MNCLKSTSDTWDTINDTLMEMDCIGEAIPLISTQSVQAQIYKCEHQPATNNNNGICKIEVVNPCSHKVCLFFLLLFIFGFDKTVLLMCHK